MSILSISIEEEEIDAMIDRLQASSIQITKIKQVYSKGYVHRVEPKFTADMNYYTQSISISSRIQNIVFTPTHT